MRKKQHYLTAEMKGKTLSLIYKEVNPKALCDDIVIEEYDITYKNGMFTLEVGGEVSVTLPFMGNGYEFTSSAKLSLIACLVRLMDMTPCGARLFRENVELFLGYLCRMTKYELDLLDFRGRVRAVTNRNPHTILNLRLSPTHDNTYVSPSGALVYDSTGDHAWQAAFNDEFYADEIITMLEILAESEECA